MKPRSRRGSSCLWGAVVWWLEMNLHASNNACRTVSARSFRRAPAPMIPPNHTEGRAVVETGVHRGAAGASRRGIVADTSKIEELKMAEISGGELLARALEAEGIEFLIGLPSPESDPLISELEAHGIQLVPVRHEAAGVHMAEGLYKTTGRASAVLGNPGPVSANLLPGVITARHEGVPVLVLTSQHRLGIAYPSPPSTFQGQDQLDVFRPTVKWGGPILEWVRIPEVLRSPFAKCGTGGPARCTSSCPPPSSMPWETTRPRRSSLRPGTAGRVRTPAGRSSTRQRCCSPERSGRSPSPARGSTAPMRMTLYCRSSTCSVARS